MFEAAILEGKPDYSKRSCYDCTHCKAAVSWWCTSEEAIDFYDTRIPGRENCNFWEPAPFLKDIKGSKDRIVLVKGIDE